MIASLLFRRSHRRFLAACDDPLRAQADRLRAILGRAEHTTIGQLYHFGGLRRIAGDVDLVRAYQDEVPIRTHAGMREDLDAVHAGEWQRLCPSPPIFFAMTAGSTGKFKYIPITNEFRRELREASMVWNGALEAQFPETRTLKLQFLVGSAEGGRSPGGVPQGFVSGFNYRNFPWLVRRRFVVPYWVFTLDDAEERAYAAGRILVSERRLGTLCALSPVNLINLREALERHPERLFRDIAAGTLAVRGRAAVSGTFRTRPDPELAASLQVAWARQGKLPAKLLFPSLRVLVCWQGGNMGYHLHGLEQAFGLERHFEFPVSASEGVFAIPVHEGGAGGALAITSHFLEFLPESSAPREVGRALRADELEPGAEYRVVVTNGGGLHRYDMEDVVRVTGRLGRTPTIEFVSKVGRRTSVSNERITELDVTHAMRAASASRGQWFREFLFVPCSDRRYRVVIDGAELGTPAARTADGGMSALASELERQLQAAAVGYAFEREDALLEPLELLVTAPGELTAHLGRATDAPPIPSAQSKPLRLTSEFDLHRRFRIERTYAA